MKQRYYYVKNVFDYKEKETYCTQKQWEYWNRKAIAEHKKKMGKWYDAMFSPTTNWR